MDEGFTGPILVVAGLNFVRAAKKKPQSFWTEAFSLVAGAGFEPATCWL